MNEGRFGTFSGRIINVVPLEGYGNNSDCFVMFTLQDKDRNIVNFVVTPETYVRDGIYLKTGEEAVGFYDKNEPTVLIYPPQYRASVFALVKYGETIAVSYFDWNLISEDRTLKLNPSSRTSIVMENGILFQGDIVNRNLIVVYKASTRSIPAQTIPEEIIVMC